MSEYIYAVDEDRRGNIVMCRAEIIRETPKQIRTGRTGLAFHCRSNHVPGDVHRTPEAARDAFIARETRNAEGWERTAAKSRRLIKAAAAMSLKVSTGVE